MRTTIVSTSKLKNYRTIIFTIDVIILKVLIGNALYSYTQDGNWTMVVMPFIIYLQFHMIMAFSIP